MSERPILFSAPMVNAILAGRKTQTRRTVKLPEGLTKPIFLNEEAGQWGWWWVEYRWEGHGLNAREIPYAEHFHAIRAPCQPGDTLYVRETFRLPAEYDDWKPKDVRQDVPIWYEADGGAPEGWGKTRVSIHLPRWASRITLRCTDVRVERLNDCSEADAIAEGVHRIWPEGSASDTGPNRYTVEVGQGSINAPTAVETYSMLWDFINGEGAWAKNPLIWVISFEVAG